MPNNEFENVKTSEEVENSISAAFDSVHLINTIIAGTTMVNQSIENKKDTVERNVGHLNIMMEKQWFVDGLSSEQKTDIEDCISAGDTYITE